MAVRTAYPGTQSAGDVLTSANFSKLPGGWIGYAEVTADQGSIGTGVTDLTSLTVTVTVGTDRRIKITGYAWADNATASDATATLLIRESSTTLNSAISYVNQTGVGGDYHTLVAQVVLTPAAGSHTYKLSMQFSGGAANQMLASATNPAYILVEDIGPAT